MIPFNPSARGSRRKAITVNELYQSNDSDEYQEVNTLTGIEIVPGDIEQYAVMQEQDEDDGSMLVEEYLADDLQTDQMNGDELPYLYENEDGSTNSEDTLYNCNVCGMDFQSIDEHIANYHSGQDVIVDVSPDENEASVVQQIKNEPEFSVEEQNTNDSVEYEVTEAIEEELEDPLEYDPEEQDYYPKLVTTKQNATNRIRKRPSSELVYDIRMAKVCRKDFVKTETVTKLNTDTGDTAPEVNFNIFFIFI